MATEHRSLSTLTRRRSRAWSPWMPNGPDKGRLGAGMGRPRTKKHLLFLLYIRLGRIWRVETRNIENTEGRPCDLVLARETEEQADRCGSLLRRSPSLPTL